MLSDLVVRLRSLFRRNTVEAELDDERFREFKIAETSFVRLSAPDSGIGSAKIDPGLFTKPFA